MTSPKRLARVAGVLYLLLAVFNGLAELYVRATIVERGDAAATAKNVVANATLFRLGFVSDLVGITCYSLLAHGPLRAAGTRQQGRRDGHGDPSSVVLLPAVIAELWMVGYLLMKGVRISQSDPRVPITA